MKIIDHMRRCTEEYSKVTGLRFGVLQTPAESTCHRLALIDRKMFGDRVVVQGDRLTESIYYTNNSHVVPSANIPLGERIKIESSFHPLTRGGAILHVWLGEANPSPEALFNLTKRIASGSLAAYFAYTKDLTVCKQCSNVAAGLLQTCPNCSAVDPVIE